MIKLTEFTQVVDIYKKNFNLRKKKFDNKKKKDLKLKREKRESRIEFKKLLGIDKIGKNISNKSSNIFDNVIRFAGFALLGVVLKNLDKIFTFAKTIIDKIKEYAIQFKNYFDNTLKPIFLQIYGVGKTLGNAFVGIAKFTIDMIPFEELTDTLGIAMRGILELGRRLTKPLLYSPSGAVSTPPGFSGVKVPVESRVLSKTPSKITSNVRFKEVIPIRKFAGVVSGSQPKGPSVPISSIKTRQQLEDFFNETFEQQVKNLPDDELKKLSKSVDADLSRAASAQLTKNTRARLKDAKFYKKFNIDRTSASAFIDAAEDMADYVRSDTLDDLLGKQRVFPSFEDFLKPKDTPIEKFRSASSRFLQKGKDIFANIKKGKDVLGNFTNSFKNKVGNAGDALKKIGSLKTPGIGILQKIPPGVQNFIGKSLRVLGLGLLAAEIAEDFRRGDNNAVVVKLTAYGLGWLVTSAGLLAGSALGVSGIGTLAGIGVLAGSIGAGSGTEILIRKLLLGNRETIPQKAPSTLSPKKPKVQTPIPNPNKRADEDNYDSGGNKIEIGDTVGYDISRGLNSPTTYGNQGMMTSREVIIAIQPVEKEVPVPV